MSRPYRVLTLEEARARPPLTEAEAEANRLRVAAILADAARNREEFLASGGKLMTEEEWQEFWDGLDAGYLDDDPARPPK